MRKCPSFASLDGPWAKVPPPFISSSFLSYIFFAMKRQLIYLNIHILLHSQGKEVDLFLVTVAKRVAKITADFYDTAGSRQSTIKRPGENKNRKLIVKFIEPSKNNDVFSF